MTVEEPSSAASPPEKPPHQQFEACSFTSNFWSGYLKSKEKPPDATRFNAQCSHCDEVFEARKETLRKHAAACPKMTAAQKHEYMKKNADEP